MSAMLAPLAFIAVLSATAVLSAYLFPRPQRSHPLSCALHSEHTGCVDAGLDLLTRRVCVCVCVCVYTHLDTDLSHLLNAALASRFALYFFLFCFCDVEPFVAPTFPHFFFMH